MTEGTARYTGKGSNWAEMEKAIGRRDALEEREYRRGYCDGFIVATEYIPDAAPKKGWRKVYDLLYDHWEKVLPQWRSGDASTLVLPPKMATETCARLQRIEAEHGRAKAERAEIARRIGLVEG